MIRETQNMVKKQPLEHCDAYIRNPFTGRCITSGGAPDAYLRKLAHFRNQFIGRLMAHGIGMREATLSYNQWRYIARLTDDTPAEVEFPDPDDRPKRLAKNQVATPPDAKYMTAREVANIDTMINQHLKSKSITPKRVEQPPPRSKSKSKSRLKTPVRGPSASRPPVAVRNIDETPAQTAFIRERTECIASLLECNNKVQRLQRQLQERGVITKENVPVSKTAARIVSQKMRDIEEEATMLVRAYRNSPAVAEAEERRNAAEAETVRQRLSRNQGMGLGRCNRFIFFLGAGASADAGISVFRTDEYEKNPLNGPIVKEAQRSWREHYATDDLKSSNKKYIELRPGLRKAISPQTPIQDLINTKLKSNEQILSNVNRPSFYSNNPPGMYPLVLMDVIRFLYDKMRGTYPNYTHQAMEHVFGNNNGVMVVSMNIDGLEWTLNLNGSTNAAVKDVIMPLHGNIFTASDRTETFNIESMADIRDDDYSEITLYGEEQYYLPEQEMLLTQELQSGACLVVIGTSSSVLPPMVTEPYINHLIVVNPSPVHTKRTIEAFKNVESVEPFKTMQEFMGVYYPDFQMAPKGQYFPNSDHGYMGAMLEYMKRVIAS
jgi:NAD-dependent SIR2 family protein deacetylase